MSFQAQVVWLSVFNAEIKRIDRSYTTIDQVKSMPIFRCIHNLHKAALLNWMLWKHQINVRATNHYRDVVICEWLWRTRHAMLVLSMNGLHMNTTGSANPDPEPTTLLCYLLFCSEMIHLLAPGNILSQGCVASKSPSNPVTNKMGKAFVEKKSLFIHRAFFSITSINMGNLLSRSSSEDKGRKRALDADEASDSFKRSRFDQEPAIVIKESDVGIVAYVNPHLKGFHSILKYR